MALGKRTQQSANEMPAHRKSERLCAQEIDYATGQKRWCGWTRVIHGMNQKKAETRSQTEEEERHRSRSDTTRDRQAPGELVARVFTSFFSDHNCIGHGELPSEKPLKHFKK
jgi:hypothetical protein